MSYKSLRSKFSLMAAGTAAVSCFGCIQTVPSSSPPTENADCIVGDKPPDGFPHRSNEAEIRRCSIWEAHTLSCRFCSYDELPRYASQACNVWETLLCLFLWVLRCSCQIICAFSISWRRLVARSSFKCNGICEIGPVILPFPCLVGSTV